MRLLALTLFAGGLLTLGGCTSSKVLLGEDDAGSIDRDAGPPGRIDAGPTEPCGDNRCVAGEYCCNASCGFCAPEGETCIEIACPPEPVFCNGVECSDDTATCCPGCNPGESFCSGPGGTCPAIDCPPPGTCPDGTECGDASLCCPGCHGEYFCSPSPTAGCPDIACPPLCGDDECDGDSLCCEGCPGDEPFCAPPGEMCPAITCPGTCDGLCEAGQTCCSTCEGRPFCSDGPCPATPCPEPGCEDQDARGEGACLLALGYAWYGGDCYGLGGCECVGADCDSLYATYDACIEAHAGCFTGEPGCSTDAECPTTGYCNGCAHGSCPFCDDCVADCVPHRCPTEAEVECRMGRPDCGDNGVAVARDGCWLCVDRESCEPIEDCRTAGCAEGEECTRCFESGTWECLGPDGICL